MKKVVIVAGAHGAGKSLTINCHLKPLLGIGYYAHKFTLSGKNGYVFSQSLEESGLDVEAIRKYFHYDLLVFAARPETESGSKLNLIRDMFQKASFAVNVVSIQEESEAPEKAKEVFSLLNSN